MFKLTGSVQVSPYLIGENWLSNVNGKVAHVQATTNKYAEQRYILHKGIYGG